MVICCVVGCKSNSRKSKVTQDLIFFNVPKTNETQFELWKSAIPRNDQELIFGKHYSICSLHFSKDEFKQINTYTIDGECYLGTDTIELKEDAIPTIFENLTTNKPAISKNNILKDSCEVNKIQKKSITTDNDYNDKTTKSEILNTVSPKSKGEKPKITTNRVLKNSRGKRKIQKKSITTENDYNDNLTKSEILNTAAAESMKSITKTTNSEIFNTTAPESEESVTVDNDSNEQSTKSEILNRMAPESIVNINPSRVNCDSKNRTTIPESINTEETIMSNEQETSISSEVDSTKSIVAHESASLERSLNEDISYSSILIYSSIMSLKFKNWTMMEREDCIMAFHINAENMNDKRIRILNDLSIQVYSGKVQVSIDQITSIKYYRDLKRLVTIVENIPICAHCHHPSASSETIINVVYKVTDEFSLSSSASLTRSNSNQSLLGTTLLEDNNDSPLLSTGEVKSSNNFEETTTTVRSPKKVSSDGTSSSFEQQYDPLLSAEDVKSTNNFVATSTIKRSPKKVSSNGTSSSLEQQYDTNFAIATEKSTSNQNDERSLLPSRSNLFEDQETTANSSNEDVRNRSSEIIITGTPQLTIVCTDTSPLSERMKYADAPQLIIAPDYVPANKSPRKSPRKRNSDTPLESTKLPPSTKESEFCDTSVMVLKRFNHKHSFAPPKKQVTFRPSNTAALNSLMKKDPTKRDDRINEKNCDEPIVDSTIKNGVKYHQIISPNSSELKSYTSVPTSRSTNTADDSSTNENISSRKRDQSIGAKSCDEPICGGGSSSSIGKSKKDERSNSDTNKNRKTTEAGLQNTAPQPAENEHHICNNSTPGVVGRQPVSDITKESEKRKCSTSSSADGGGPTVLIKRKRTYASLPSKSALSLPQSVGFGKNNSKKASQLIPIVDLVSDEEDSATTASQLKIKK